MALIIVVLVTNKCSSSSQSKKKNKPPPSNIIPITILSRFLGSGKTTLLQHLLQNRQGYKVAVVVNDVASVNIDAKLLENQQSSQSPTSTTTTLSSNNTNSDTTATNNLSRPDGLIELQNGCACCSLGDELFQSLSQLVTISDLKEFPHEHFQHIISIGSSLTQSSFGTA